MKRLSRLLTILIAGALIASLLAGCFGGSGGTGGGQQSSQAGGGNEGGKKSIAYLTPSTTIPFWNYVEDGIRERCEALGYELTVYDSKDEASTQLKNAQNAITKEVDAIIISPTDSASCPAVLNEAQAAGVPVVIADIGTESGEYVSYVATPNKEGAREVGDYVAAYILENGLPKGPVAEITVPLARINGQNRQAGFKEAMDAEGITMGTVLQSVDFTLDEGEKFTQNIVTGEPNLVGIWSHHSQATLGVVKALDDMSLTGKVFVACFDGDPDIVKYLKEGKILICGAQQPVEMGRQAMDAVEDTFNGRSVPKQIDVPVLILTADNIEELEATAERTVYTVR